MRHEGGGIGYPVRSHPLRVWAGSAILAACAHGGGHLGPVMPYPTKEVVRQEMVLEQAVDQAPARVPTETTERVSGTKYYLFSRDGLACEVDFMVYIAVQPGDRVSCHWLAPSAAVQTPR
jgi:hypothetical protein